MAAAQTPLIRLLVEVHAFMQALSSMARVHSESEKKYDMQRMKLNKAGLCCSACVVVGELRSGSTVQSEGALVSCGRANSLQGLPLVYVCKAQGATTISHTFWFWLQSPLGLSKKNPAEDLRMACWTCHHWASG